MTTKTTLQTSAFVIAIVFMYAAIFSMEAAKLGL